MIKIIADEKIPFLKGALDDVVSMKYLPGKDISKKDIADADGLIIRTRTKCNEKLLGDSKLKFITSATVGYDHIDTAYCDDKDIKWTNSPGCNSSSVEQYIVSALLELQVNFGYDLEAKTIGIVGVGNVGSKVARVAKLLGMKVLLNDPPRARVEGDEGFVSLKEIKEKSDIITFHTPLTQGGIDNTYHLADNKFFKDLKKSIVLINAARGEIVESGALSEAIDKQQVRLSVVDVWENEPDLDLDLLRKVKIGTAHIAGYSTDGKVNGTAMAVKSASDFFELKLDNWKPDTIPGPNLKQFVVDCTGFDKMEILYEVYRKCYDIIEDDEQLRKDPLGFEQLRGSYRIRREAPYFSVRLNNNPYEEIPKILEGLGFTVLEIDCFC